MFHPIGTSLWSANSIPILKQIADYDHAIIPYS